MLPAPVSFQRNTGIFSHPLRFFSKLPRASARLINLNALLAAVVALSVLLNLRFIYYSSSARDGSTSANTATPLPLRSIVDTFPARSAASSDLDHLIVVPGHSIWVGTHAEDAEVEDGWLLGDYQKGRASPSLFRAHIARSSQIAIADPRALLIFSGGYTSPLTATSEGESYLRLARTTGLLPPADQFTRVATEDASLDSFQNVLFSIARFRELTGAYPTRITVVGHNFKRRRFEQLHRRALRWPELRFAYEGLLLRNEEDEREAAAGELAKSYNPYTKDLYGCHAPLVQKRAGRNFHMRSHGYHVGAPEIRELLEWCPKDGKQIFPGNLPWGKGKEL